MASFLQRTFSKNEPRTSFRAPFFVEHFDKNFPFEMLHKLAKCHYQTVFTSQVIWENVFLVSY